MRTHVLRVSRRSARCDDLVLVQGTVGEDRVVLALDEEWAGLEVSVAFMGCGAKVSPAAGHDGTYVVPWEVMERPGAVSVAVEGRADGVVLRHATMERPFVVRPSCGAGDSTTPAEPTETELQAAAREAREAAEDARDAAEEVIRRADAGELDGPQGPPGPQGVGVPDFTDADEGKVLTVQDGETVWGVSSGGSAITPGHGLRLDGSVLAVDMAAGVEQDNTLPISSADVYTTVGNIESLLATI